MTAVYARQRAALLAVRSEFASFLPENAPAENPVRPMPGGELRALLREPANNRASLVLVVGWGDGSVVRALLSDPNCRDKDVSVLLLAGEEQAFAASFRDETLHLLQTPRLRFNLILRREDLATWATYSYAGHEDITKLAGADFVDRHPLSPEGERFRATYLNEIYTVLADRPQCIGNDIVDTFTGLYNSALNAGSILPGPTFDEIGGTFGDTPIISIAAGPSLRRHIPRLKELQDRCILVACDAVFHGLLDAGIEPHFVTPIERVDVIVRMLSRASETTRTHFAGSMVCLPECVRPFGERTIGVYGGDRVYPWLLPEVGKRVNTGSSTGVFSVTVGAALGRGPLFLVGHDLAKSETDSHWEGASHAAEDWKHAKRNEEKAKTGLSGYEERQIPGNDGRNVTTITWWARFRDEISAELAPMVAHGRKVFNVNAHERIFARIDHTEAAPLPDPASLPKMGEFRLPARKPERLRQWQERARELPADADRLAKHIAGLRDDVVALRRTKRPGEWPLEELAKRLDLTAEVSAGNHMAFSYFLRSALHNSVSEMHRFRRTPSKAQAHSEIIDSMDYLCQGVTNALEKLRPRLEEIVRDCT